MHFSKILLISAGAITTGLAQGFMVPTPWSVQKINIGNIRHGTGGFWSFNLIDTPTPAPQGLNVTCSYNSRTTYRFAIDGAPIEQPCSGNPNVTFSLYPAGDHFTFNITHLYGNCGTADSPSPCNDNGTWRFSRDDVLGQEFDVQNNFGQSGSFNRDSISMYPKRAILSLKCEFC
ncbi:hypothetical protein SBOR_8820 [Sclerotinia borealis F-4128]|uniref:AA1-like domain-containing protein n=1 Tax=Sclerotinia borealis (strain F-4128) TaxID=1432307 RepID=W9C4K3_SCLBF|nr:hypothetical protein SBOR_8820 [Sclerotinia borealis F-4128]